MAKNRTMAIKHKKARVEAMKEANEIQLKGVMGDYEHGWVKECTNGVKLYSQHVRFMEKKHVVKRFEKPVIPSRKDA